MSNNWNGFENNQELDQAIEQKYLIFRLGTEMYGTPLLGVREVVQPQRAKPIPNTVPYFRGLINIRGQIVGLVDLRVRFDYPTESLPNQALLVFETETGPVAAIVDAVEAVIKIDDEEIHKNPNIKSQVPTEFLIGIANHQDRLVTLIDLNKTFTEADYVEIRRSKMLAG